MWQYAILSVVSDIPGLNQGQVAEMLLYSANRITADLDELQQRGLVIREPGEDRRANLLWITDRGTDLQRRVQDKVRDQEDELLACLTPTQLHCLHTALQRVARQIRAEPASRQRSRGPSPPRSA
jgi:DNA-binding MarR family transcriptional regulator